MTVELQAEVIARAIEESRRRELHAALNQWFADRDHTSARSTFERPSEALLDRRLQEIQRRFEPVAYTRALVSA